MLRTETLVLLEGRDAPQTAAEADWDAILRVGDTFVNDFLAAYDISARRTEAGWRIDALTLTVRWATGNQAIMSGAD